MQLFKNFFGKTTESGLAAAEDHINKGIASFTQGKHKQAFADFNKAIKKAPGYAYAYHARGLAYVGIGEYSQGETDRDVAIKLDPDSAARYHYEYGSTYSEIGEHERAITEFDCAIRLRPEFAEAHHNRGVTNTRGGQLDEAISDFERAMSLDPNDADNFAGRGYAYSAKGENSNAIADFTRAIEMIPDYTPAYQGRARIYRVEGHWHLAVADLTQAIRIAPEDIGNYRERAQLFSDSRQYDKAIADCDRVIELNPIDVAGLLMRGDAYARQWEEDAESWHFGYNLSRTNVTEEEAIKVWAISHILTYDRAIEDYKMACKLQPKNRDLKEFADIIETSTLAIKTDPKDGHAYHARAGAYRFFSNGTLDLAIANYDQAINLAREWTSSWGASIDEGQRQFPYLAYSYQSRGKAHASLGQWDQARSDFAMANRLAEYLN